MEPLTPILPETIDDRNALFKVERQTPSGSFKYRGMKLMIETMMSKGYNKFVSSSGGNAGYSAALVCKQLGLECTVITPSSTSEYMIELIQSAGATVVVHGKDWQEADKAAKEYINDSTYYVHPFNDPLLWQGYEAIVEEVIKEKAAFDSVIVSVGGGGLFCGIAQGLKKFGLDRIPIITAETLGAASMAASIHANAHVEIDQIDTIAVTLGARKVANRAFELSRTRPVIGSTVSDEAALNAAKRFFNKHGISVEPACGAALAVAYEGLYAEYKSPLVIVCGGVAVDFKNPKTIPTLQR